MQQVPMPMAPMMPAPLGAPVAAAPGTIDPSRQAAMQFQRFAPGFLPLSMP